MGGLSRASTPVRYQHPEPWAHLVPAGNLVQHRLTPKPHSGRSGLNRYRVQLQGVPDLGTVSAHGSGRIPECADSHLLESNPSRTTLSSRRIRCGTSSSTHVSGTATHSCRFSLVLGVVRRTLHRHQPQFGTTQSRVRSKPRFAGMRHDFTGGHVGVEFGYLNQLLRGSMIHAPMLFFSIK